MPEATDGDLSDKPRYDWEYRAVCSAEGADHIELESDATNTVYKAREALPLDCCPAPECDAPLDIEIEQQRTGVMTQ
jgi:hypothetical protein